MAGRLFILQSVADFAPGYFENTAVEGSCVQLHSSAGAYPESGSYTSQSFSVEAFFSLIPSWNAEVPEGTAVEMQVRVATSGRWSKWFSFGRWSPYLGSESPKQQQDDIALVERDMLCLADGSPAADVVQMRLFMYSVDGKATPRLWLLGVSTNATKQMGQELRAFGRLLEVPSYSCQNRDPEISGRIAGVTSLTMLMNRWGRDLLPEEVARAAYDKVGTYNNLAFLAAAAGIYGFSCHVGYTGMSVLRRQIWEGRCVAARVHYRSEAVPGEEEREALEGRVAAPMQEQSDETGGHLVVVRGFVTRGEREVVVVNDPMAQSDDAVTSEIPLPLFAKMYTGLALFVQPRPGAAGLQWPRRRVGELVVQQDTLLFSYGDKTLAQLLDAASEA